MPVHSLFTSEQQKRLFCNHYRSLCMGILDPNFKPVALLYAEKLKVKFLVTQLVHGDPDCASVLADDGDEDIRINVIRLDEMEEFVKSKGDVLKVDPSFDGKYNLSVYAKVADKLGKILTDDQDEGAKELFAKFGNDPKHNEEFKNVRRFRFQYIW